jgi:hypothetical protein
MVRASLATQKLLYGRGIGPSPGGYGETCLIVIEKAVITESRTTLGPDAQS